MTRKAAESVADWKTFAPPFWPQCTFRHVPQWEVWHDTNKERGGVLMDMRECEAGSVLDEFHFSMWAGFLRSMLGNDAVRAQFESDTGLQPLIMSPPKNGLERMIDEATGVGQMQADYMSKFAVWVTDAYWGGPEHICPAIEATMRGAS